MTTNYLIGKKILEIRCRISKVEYEGNIPLEQIEVEMKLSSGEIIAFPPYPKAELDIKPNFNPKLERIFPKNGFFIFLVKSNRLDNLKNQKIVGISSITIDIGEEICSIEFQNGCFLTKGPVSPMGTGNTDLFLFESNEALMKKYTY